MEKSIDQASPRFTFSFFDPVDSIIAELPMEPPVFLLSEVLSFFQHLQHLLSSTTSFGNLPQQETFLRSLHGKLSGLEALHAPSLHSLVSGAI
ncbi:hypothetical protein AAC387_Pa05g2564 [Persea americana]